MIVIEVKQRDLMYVLRFDTMDEYVQSHRAGRLKEFFDKVKSAKVKFFDGKPAVKIAIEDKDYEKSIRILVDNGF